METTPQGKRPIGVPNYVGTAVAVIVAFLLGIFVGLHPSWIPLRPTGPSDADVPGLNSTSGLPAQNHDLDGDQSTTQPMAQPTTEPTTAP